MKARIVFVIASVLASLVAVALVVFTLSQATPLGGFFTFDNVEAATAPRNGSSLLVSRAISIPFGIDDSLVLSGGAQVVNVEGHGDCQEGETFRLKVDVTQGSIKGVAHLEGECQTGEFPWALDVNTPGSKSFSPEAARACGHVVVHFDREGAIVHDWCKNVTLTSE